MKFEIKIENNNGKEQGYGLYINVYEKESGILYGSTMVTKDATSEQIKKAEKSAKAKATRKYNKETDIH